MTLQRHCSPTVQEPNGSTKQASGKKENSEQGPTAAQPEADETGKPQAPSRATSGSLWLEALAGCFKGQVWEVGVAGATIGRASDNYLSLADKEMSRRHSKVRRLVAGGVGGGNYSEKEREKKVMAFVYGSLLHSARLMFVRCWRILSRYVGFVPLVQLLETIPLIV